MTRRAEQRATEGRTSRDVRLAELRAYLAALKSNAASAEYRLVQLQDERDRVAANLGRVREQIVNVERMIGEG